MELKNKTILITGASSGIGQAIAIACAKQGATVLINYRSSKQGAGETLKQVEKFSKGFIFQADLIDRVQIKKMFSEIAEKVGAIDCVINNAGDGRNSDFFDNETWQYQMENIFLSAVHVTQNFLKQNEPAEIRKIINISSVYGLSNMGNPEMMAYSAAKAALINFTKTLAKEYSSVFINAIAPGYIETPAWAGVSDKDKAVCADKTMIKRFIKAEEIAQAAIALLENDAMTGQVIVVDGGLSLQSMAKK